MTSYWKCPESTLKDNSDCINQVQCRGKSNETTSAITAVRRSCGICILANFNLLRNAREDIIKKPWANLNGRAAMDGYFKLQ